MQEATNNNMTTRREYFNLLKKGRITPAEFEELTLHIDKTNMFDVNEDCVIAIPINHHEQWQVETISKPSRKTRKSAKKNKDMRLCMRNGQNIKVTMNRGTVTKYGNYRRDTNTLQDIETGTHYHSPTDFVQAQYLKINKVINVNGWDKIHCFTNDGWVIMNTLRT